MSSQELSFQTSVVERAYAYWASKCAGGRVPRRADLRPEEMPLLLPYVFLVDVEWQPLAFRFRLVGTEITRLAQREYTGVRVNAEEYGSCWKNVFSTYSRVVYSARPEVAIWSAPWNGRDFLTYERLIAPLCSAGGEIGMLFGALHPITSELAVSDGTSAG